ncbi:MAG: hypothetical protein K1X79_12025 [Oligoflexia bacterium]|nr:hypothetical protein [Oligoflexia bacterium]
MSGITVRKISPQLNGLPKEKKLRSALSSLRNPLLIALVLSAFSACDMLPTPWALNQKRPAVQDNARSFEASLSDKAASAAPESPINASISPDKGLRPAIKIKASIDAERFSQIKSQLGELIHLSVVGGGTGKVILVDRGGQVRLRSLGGKVADRLIYQTGERVDSVAISPDGLRIALALARQVLVVSLSDGAVAFKRVGMKARAASLDFDRSGEALLIGSNDGVVYRWRFVDEQDATSTMEREKCFERYIAHSSVLSSVRFHPRGRVFFSADWQGVLNAWAPYDADENDGEFDRNLFGARGYIDRANRVRASRNGGVPVTDMELAPDGESLFLALSDGTIEWWQVRGFKKLAEQKIGKGAVLDLAFSEDGQRLASVHQDGIVRVWEQMVSEQEGVTDKAYTLKRIYEAPVPSARIVRFVGSRTLAVGTSQGEVSISPIVE